MSDETDSSNWSDSESNYIDNNSYSYQFGNSLAKGKKASPSHISLNDAITESSAGIQNRPLSDITLSICNTNEHQNDRKCPTFPSSSKENIQFQISSYQTVVCKGKTPNDSSVSLTKNTIFFDDKSNLKSELNFSTTSAKDFQNLRATHDSMCFCDRFYGLKGGEENETACDASYINKNLEDKCEYQLTNEDIFTMKSSNKKFYKESISSSSSDDNWSTLEDDILKDLMSQDFFTIDPQKTSQVTELFSKMDQKLPNENTVVKRKLDFGSDLCKSPTKCLKISQNEARTSHKINTQSFITDYFKIKKFSSHECQNNLSNTKLLELPNFEEATESKFNFSDNGVKLIPTSKNVSKIDAICESQNSQIFFLDADRVTDAFTNDSARITPLTNSQKKINNRLLQICKNESLIYTGPTVVFDHQVKLIRNEKIGKICAEILLQFLVSLIEDQKHLSQNGTPQTNNTCKPRLSIPYDNKCRQRKSALIIYLLGKIHSLITQNARCTQRQLYYELKTFTTDQSRIASALMSIALMIEVAPWYLPINSTSCGLVFGNLKIVTSNDNVTNCINFGGTLIPEDVVEIKEFQSDATFILVVEKDAVFKKLLDENISQTLGTSCIVITGKGFPDYNTRLFLKLLWRHLRIPIFILTDGDPYGIDIMLTYRFGSIENPHFLEDITNPKIQWIGILPSDINRLVIPCEDLKRREVERVRKMLQRPYVKENQWLHNELTIMLENKKKAGIEGVLDNHCSLTKFYITGKLFSGDFF